jgi:hypothetical protein
MYGVSDPSEEVGVDDFVLLEAYTSQDAFLDNLRLRFSANIIYVNLHTLVTILKNQFLTSFNQRPTSAQSSSVSTRTRASRSTPTTTFRNTRTTTWTSCPRTCSP